MTPEQQQFVALFLAAWLVLGAYRWWRRR